MEVSPIGFASPPLLVHDVDIPIGGIITWSGAIIDIPDHFALCDGQNGTPDLRDMFVVGAGSTYAVDDTGGTVDHKHQQGGSSVEAPAAAGNNVVPVTQDTDFSDNLPPFYALAKIMRIT